MNLPSIKTFFDLVGRLVHVEQARVKKQHNSCTYNVNDSLHSLTTVPLRLLQSTLRCLEQFHLISVFVIYTLQSSLLYLSIRLNFERLSGPLDEIRTVSVHK